MGKHSVAGKHWYTGKAGQVANSQVGIFSCNASDKCAALVDCALNLPEESADVERRAGAVALKESRGNFGEPFEKRKSRPFVFLRLPRTHAGRRWVWA